MRVFDGETVCPNAGPTFAGYVSSDIDVSSDVEAGGSS